MVVKMLIKNLSHISAMTVSLAFFIEGARLGILHIQPTSYWFMYHSITPARPHIINTQALEYDSERSVYRDINLWFNDRLYCRPWGLDVPYRHFSNNAIDHVNHPTIAENYLSGWTYKGDLPNYDADCIVRAEPAARIHHWLIFGDGYIEKLQVLWSEPVRISPPDNLELPAY